MVSYVNASFLKMFLCERCEALALVLVEFKPMKPQKVIINEVEKEKTSHHKP